MGRVKQVDTGEYSTPSKSFKGEDGRWYSSKEVWLRYKPLLEEEKRQKEYWNQCIDFMVDVCGYNDLPFPSILPKELTKLKAYGYDVVLETMQKCRGKIEYALNYVDFKSEYNKFRYLFAIIENHIFNIYEDKKNEKSHSAIVKEIDDEMYEYKQQKNKNISQYLE